MVLVIGSGRCERIAKYRTRLSTHIFRTTRWGIWIATRSICIIVWVGSWWRARRWRRRIPLGRIRSASSCARCRVLGRVLLRYGSWWRRELAGLRIEALLRSIRVVRWWWRCRRVLLGWVIAVLIRISPVALFFATYTESGGCFEHWRLPKLTFPCLALTFFLLASLILRRSNRSSSSSGRHLPCVS